MIVSQFWMWYWKTKQRSKRCKIIIIKMSYIYTNIFITKDAQKTFWNIFKSDKKRKKKRFTSVFFRLDSPSRVFSVALHQRLQQMRSPPHRSSCRDRRVPARPAGPPPGRPRAGAGQWYLSWPTGLLPTGCQSRRDDISRRRRHDRSLSRISRRRAPGTYWQARRRGRPALRRCDGPQLRNAAQPSPLSPGLHLVLNLEHSRVGNLVHRFRGGG